MITDEKGNTYDASMSGGGEGPDKDGNRRFKQTLHVNGLDHKPQRLTLTLQTIEKRYTDVNWQVKLPSQ